MIAKSKKLLPVSLLAVTLGLSGCSSMGTGEGVGTALGAGLGGLIGSQFGSGTGKLIATGLGVAAGGYIGNQIGRYLDEQDKQRHAASMQNAAISGKSQSWSNPETGASGSVQVTGQKSNQGDVKMKVLKDRVAETPPIDLIGATYKSASDINVRGGPGTDYKVTSSLKKDEATQVVGKVQGKNWYMISEGGAASGFVFADLLSPAPNAAIDDNETPSGEVTDAVVAANQTCQVTTTTVKYADGRTEQDEVLLCPTADGGMEIRES